MKAIVVTDPKQDTTGMILTDRPMPTPSLNDVIVQVCASGFTKDELTWGPTWVDRTGKDRTPTIPGHELAGIVVGLGYGTTGFSIGQRVVGLTDWTRNGSLAEYIAIEARNLAPLPADVGFVEGAALVMSGLTAWQGLFVHGNLQAGQTVLIHGSAGVVGSMVVQLARAAGAYVIGTGRTDDRQLALDFGVHQFVDLEREKLEDIGEVDLLFDIFGGDTLLRSAGLIRNGGRLVTIAGPTDVRPTNGVTIDFVVEAIPSQLNEVVQRFREGKLKLHIGQVASLDDAIAAFHPAKKSKGKTIIEIKN